MSRRMMGLPRKSAGLASALACVTMFASPFAAVAEAKTIPITVPLSARPLAADAWTPADEAFSEHRRWRGRRHRDGIDGGDLIGGLLILGGIAAVASAIDKSKEERRQRTEGRDYPYPDRSSRDRPYDYRDSDRRDDWRSGGANPSRELDRAVQACSAEAGRAGSVDRIHDVEKTDGEWRVRGDYQGGREFTCTVDSSGRAYVGTGDRSDNGDWDARGGDDDGPVAQVSGADEDDGRYGAAQAPDFEDTRSR